MTDDRDPVREAWKDLYGNDSPAPRWFVRIYDRASADATAEIREQAQRVREARQTMIDRSDADDFLTACAGARLYSEAIAALLEIIGVCAALDGKGGGKE